MPKRLKVLISGYACEPDKGSEPEVGWQWARQMCGFHDVTVLTRANNRATIERELASMDPKEPRPRFVFHDEGPFWLWLKWRFKAVRLYYHLWQISARNVIERLHREIGLFFCITRPSPVTGIARRLEAMALPLSGDRSAGLNRFPGACCPGAIRVHLSRRHCAA
jgi:hypothetical protein